MKIPNTNTGQNLDNSFYLRYIKMNLFQAWFAGQNMVDHDKYITNIRETDIKDTIDEILDYEYRTREELEKVWAKVCRSS